VYRGYGRGCEGRASDPGCLAFTDHYDGRRRTGACSNAIAMSAVLIGGKFEPPPLQGLPAARRPAL